MTKLNFILFSSILLISNLQASEKIPSEVIRIEKSEKAKGFGGLVEHYEKGRKGPSKEVFELITKYVKRDEPVLDVGCGTGRGTLPLMEKFDNVRGSDWDEKMLQHAESKAPGHFDHASAYDLPYQNGQFGLVTAFAAYHWFCDDAATQEISRVLKPRGYMIVCGKDGANSNAAGILNEAEASLADLLANVEVTDPRENYEPIETLKRNGFEIVAVEKISATQEYTIDEAVQYLQSRSAWNYIIKANKEEIAEKKLREFFENVKDNDGKIRIPSSSTVIIARKL